MNDVEKTMDLYRSYVTKRAYYVIALCVASIGFSVSQTMDRQLSPSLVPLALAVTLFLLSILSGFGLIKCMTQGLSLEMILKKTVDGKHTVAGYDLDLQERIYNSNAKSLISLSDWGTFYEQAQKWCFYVGVLAFIGWRIYEMYLLSIASA